MCNFLSVLFDKMSYIDTILKPGYAGARPDIYVKDVYAASVVADSMSLVPGTTPTDPATKLLGVTDDGDVTTVPIPTLSGLGLDLNDYYNKNQVDTLIADPVPYTKISHGTFSETVRYGPGAGAVLSTASGGNSGIQNTCIGQDALTQASGLCYSNVAVGFKAGYGVMAGSSYQNVFIGRNAGNNGEPGNSNVCIGASANSGTFSNCISLGYNTTSSADGQIKIITTPSTGGTFVSGIRQYSASGEDIIATIGSDNRLGSRSLTSAVTGICYTKAEIGDLFYTKVTTQGMLNEYQFYYLPKSTQILGSSSYNNGRRLRENVAVSTYNNISIGEYNFTGDTTVGTAQNNIVIGRENMLCGASTAYTNNILLGARLACTYVGASFRRNIMLGNNCADNIAAESLIFEDNFIVGEDALRQATSKDYRVKNNVLLMPGAKSLTAHLDNEIWLGNNTHMALRCEAVTNFRVSSGSPLYYDTNGYIGYVSSSQRYKHDIIPVSESDIDAYDAMMPVSFRYNSDIDPDTAKTFGYIAEDVLPELQIRRNGVVETINFNALNSLQHASHKRLQQRVNDLEQKVNQLEQMISNLTANA